MGRAIHRRVRQENRQADIKSVLGKTQTEVKEKLTKAIAEAETLDAQRVDEYLSRFLQHRYGIGEQSVL